MSNEELLNIQRRDQGYTELEIDNSRGYQLRDRRSLLNHVAEMVLKIESLESTVDRLNEQVERLL